MIDSAASIKSFGTSNDPVPTSHALVRQISYIRLNCQLPILLNLSNKNVIAYKVRKA